MPAELRPPKLFTSDINAERLQALMAEHGERMGLHSDESGVFAVMAGLYSGGAANIDAFLQAHAGSSMRVERMGRSAYIDRAALAINLMIQPGIMAEVAGSNRFRGAGLLARFLFCVPPNWIGARDVREWGVGETVEFTPNAIAYPGPFWGAGKGTWYWNVVFVSNGLVLARSATRKEVDWDPAADRVVEARLEPVADPGWKQGWRA